MGSTGMSCAGHRHRLDALIAWPDRLGPNETKVISGCTSWPVSRIEDNGATVGVLMREAPTIFSGTLRAMSGTTYNKQFEVDLLANSDDYLRRLGVRPPDIMERRRICVALARIAALLEQDGLVYAD